MSFDNCYRQGVSLAMLLTLVFGFSPSVRGDLVDITASRDNTLYEDTSGNLSNGAGQFLFSGTTSGQEIRRGLMAFDLSAIPQGATIDSVSLTLFMSRTISGDQTMSLHAATADWGEGSSNAAGQEGGGTQAEAGDATWLHTFFANDFWANAGGDFNAAASSSQTVGGIGSYTWNSTAMMVNDVQSWLDNPGSNFGWTLIGNEGVGGTAKQFLSRENSDAANRPTLTISFTTIPEPTSGLILGMVGLVATITRRRR